MYRWYVSGWVPAIIDRKAAFERKSLDYEKRQIINRAEGIVTASVAPGLLEKIEIWFMSKFLAVIAILIVWLSVFCCVF
jgi:hypothetical protein